MNAAAQTTKRTHIDPHDVCAEQPKHCDTCGEVVMSLLVNYADSSRKWVPATWDASTRAWLPHTCKPGRAEL